LAFNVVLVAPIEELRVSGGKPDFINYSGGGEFDEFLGSWIKVMGGKSNSLPDNKFWFQMVLNCFPP
jgi:hypothetical protein